METRVVFVDEEGITDYNPETHQSLLKKFICFITSEDNESAVLIMVGRQKKHIGLLEEANIHYDHEILTEDLLGAGNLYFSRKKLYVTCWFSLSLKNAGRSIQTDKSLRKLILDALGAKISSL